MKKKLDCFRIGDRKLIKTFRIMKLTFLLLIMGVLQLTASVHAQNGKLNVQAENMQLSDLLWQLQEESDLVFIYQTDDLADVPAITYEKSNATITEILDDIFEETNLDYTLNNDVVIIKKKPAKAVVVPEKEEQEKKTIKGTVTDADGNTLPGVSVVIKGTTTGVATNIDGNYTIKFDGDDAVLVFSFVGMIPQEIVYTGQNLIDVVLKASAEQMDEVFVTGYQAISSERATGSFSKVKAADLEEFYAPEVNNLLEGKVAGMIVDEQTGNIVIRGISTFNATKKPLVVIDGLPVEGKWDDDDYSALSDINPNDIASVTVLKDASASSIYGARAANGVIVVTTKSATKGKTEIEFSMNTVFTPKTDFGYYNIASVDDVIDYEKAYIEAAPTYLADPVAFFDNYDQKNIAYSPVYNFYGKMARGEITEAEAMAGIDNLRKNDYQKEYAKHAMQNQFSQQYNLSFRTGTEKSNMLLSLNYLSKKGEQINSESEKYSLYFKNNQKLNKWLNIGYGISTVVGKNKRPDVPQGNGAFEAHSYQRILDDNGNRVYRYLGSPVFEENISNTDGLKSMKYNVLDELEDKNYSSEDINLRMFFNTNAKISEWLSYDLMFQYEIVNSKNETYHKEDSYEMRYQVNNFAEWEVSPWGPEYDAYKYHLPEGGSLNTLNYSRHNYTFRNQLNFNKLFNDKHAVTGLAGFEMRENKTVYQRTDLYGYDPQTEISKPVNWNDVSAGVPGSLYPGGRSTMWNNQVKTEGKNRYISFYANGSYTFDGKYSFTGSFRIDETNLFGSDPKYRYRPLWSVGGSWLLSDESFMDNADWANMIKLRASYGLSGNVDQNSSPFLLARVGTSFWTGDNYVAINNPPNPALRWEKTTSYNIGADFSLFNNRLAGSLDVYYKYSDDLLADKQFDPAVGFWRGVVNNGAMSNKGVELSLSYDWIKNSDWSLRTNFTAAYNKNEVEKVDLEVSYAGELLNTYSDYYLEGNSINTIYSYRYAGLTDEGAPSVYDAEGNVVSGAPMEDHEALVKTGKFDPDFSGSFQPTLGYKGFALSALFVFYSGHSFINEVTPLYERVSGKVHKDIANRWTPENTNTDIPRMGTHLSTRYTSDHWKKADIHVMDASYVKLRNLAFSYTIPQQWLEAVNLNRVRLNFQVNNPWYAAANDQGVDPEAFNAKSGRRTAPIMTSYVFGVNVNF